MIFTMREAAAQKIQASAASGAFLIQSVEFRHHFLCSGLIEGSGGFISGEYFRLFRCPAPALL